MMTPATASTGITCFTPMSGVSAAVRMMPVPKPPMPPITAAPRASAATAVSVKGSSSTSARDRPRAPARVDGDVGERRLGHLHHLAVLAPALGIDLDLHCHRGGAELDQLGIAGEEIADQHRLLEDKFLHRHC